MTNLIHVVLQNCTLRSRIKWEHNILNDLRLFALLIFLKLITRGGQIDPNIDSIDTKVSIGIRSILA